MIRKYTDTSVSTAARGDLQVEISDALRDFFHDEPAVVTAPSVA